MSNLYINENPYSKARVPGRCTSCGISLSKSLKGLHIRWRDGSGLCNRCALEIRLLQLELVCKKKDRESVSSARERLRLAEDLSISYNIYLVAAPTHWLEG